MKKINTKKIITLVLWILGLSGLAASLAFASRKEKLVKIEHLNVNVSGSGENSFIDEEDVKDYLSEQKDSVVNIEKAKLDVNKIEKTLNAHPAIENADISVDVNGDVSIEVMQRTPLLRVFCEDGESYYIDTQAKLMPLSDKYTARVLIATGYIYEPYARRYQLSVKDIAKSEVFSKTSVLDDLYALADYISKDSTLADLVQQINVTKDKEFELYPSIGDHKIMFGEATDIEEKFNNLKVFYTEGLNKTNGWNKYSVINIKYKNQVVCTKKEIYGK